MESYYTSQPALLLSSAANIPALPDFTSVSAGHTLPIVSMLLFSGTILLSRHIFFLFVKAKQSVGNAGQRCNMGANYPPFLNSAV